MRTVPNVPTASSVHARRRRGKTTIVLNNTDLGHTEGDVIVYLAEEKVLFTSDLFYNEVVGFMGDGFMREWVLNLEILEGIEARTVIPGLGFPDGSVTPCGKG